MEKLIYFSGVYGYYFLIKIAAVFNRKARLWEEGRTEIATKIASFEPAKNVVWFHCSSLGEFEQARPLIEKVKINFPHSKVVLTFFSPSGYEIRKNYELADLVCYLPKEQLKSIEHFLNKIKPTCVIWVKYDFWFLILEKIADRKIPLFLMASVYRKNQYFFGVFGKYFIGKLNLFTKIFVQDVGSKNLLSSFQIPAEVAGDTRFDRVLDIYLQKKEIPNIAQFKQDKKVFIIGSAWEKEESFLLEILKTVVLKDWKIILAPHNIDSISKEKYIQKFPFEICFFDQISPTAKILVVNNMGMLSSIYQYADIALIGGGFGRSVHNILEAAVYGIPTIFGPNHTKSLEALDLLKRNLAFTFKTTEEFHLILDKLVKDHSFKPALGLYFEEHKGATDKIFTEIKSLFA